MHTTTPEAHTRQLIETYRRRLQLLELQKAKLGFAADVSMDMEREEIIDKVTTLEQRLRGVAGVTHPLRELAGPDQRPAQYHGLIVLVGPGRADKDPTTQSAGAAISYHLGATRGEGLRSCWLISSGTRQDERQRDAIDIARQLAGWCAERGVAATIWPVASGYDARETFAMVEQLFATEVPAAGLAAHEVICDFTGGTKLMSAGMVLACGERRTMQYMVYAPDGSSVPLLVRFAPEDGA